LGVDASWLSWLYPEDELFARKAAAGGTPGTNRVENSPPGAAGEAVFRDAHGQAG
jgi:hypothetical protein